MRIYLAAPWKDRQAMPAIAERLERAGHAITHKWWLIEDAPESDKNINYLKQMAEWDVEGVRNADYVVVINSAKSEGKAVEQGIAIGLGIPIICVGQRGAHSQNVFHYLDVYSWVPTIDDAIALLSN